VGDSVRIQQVRCRYRLRRRRASAAEIRWRLDHVLRDRIPGLLDTMLAERMPAGPGVIVIRRLDLKLTLSRRLYEPRAAELWSRAVAIAFSHALADGSGERVRRFESRGAQLAELCADVAAGTAWSRWYHEEFSELRSYGDSGAIRQALLRRRSEIAAALRILHRGGRLRAVAAALSDADAWTIVDAVPPVSIGPPARQVLTPKRLRDALSARREAVVALQLVAALAEADAVTERNVEIVHHLARAAPLLLEHRRVTRRLRATAAPSEAAVSLHVLSSQEPELVRAAVAAVEGSTPAVADHGEDGLELSTAFGGLFLLLPALAELDVDARLRAGGLSEDEIVRTAGVARWLVLLKCLDPATRLDARCDPGLVVAAGLASGPDSAALRRLGRLTAPPVASAVAGGTKASPDDHFRTAGLLGSKRADAAWSRVAAAALRLLARRLPGFEESSAGHLGRNVLAGPSRLRVGDDGVEVTLPRTPLEVVLRVAGWGGSVHAIPWLPGGSLSVGREPE
jgi:hypothetical protein